jgi:hypothetical protein
MILHPSKTAKAKQALVNSWTAYWLVDQACCYRLEAEKHKRVAALSLARKIQSQREV